MLLAAKTHKYACVYVSESAEASEKAKFAFFVLFYRFSAVCQAGESSVSVCNWYEKD